MRSFSGVVRCVCGVVFCFVLADVFLFLVCNEIRLR